MSQPRVLPVVGTRVGRDYLPEWPGKGRTVPSPRDGNDPAIQRWVAWRLLAGNGWELARSALVYPDVAACRTAVLRLIGALPRAEWITNRGTRPASWTWELAVDGIPAAVASRVYGLQRECEAALRTFLAILPTAALGFDDERESMSADVDERRTTSG
jgi:hypothetical protein